MKIRTFSSLEQLSNKLENLLRDRFSHPGAVMLSGGSTPYAIYNQLAASPCPVHPECRIFLSDERAVAADSPNNNAFNLKPMIKALNCEDRFIRVDSTAKTDLAAKVYGEQLQQLPPVELGLLGMGTDGHTAGLFSLEHARRNEGPLTLATSRPDGMEGITVTPAFLRRIKRIVLLVTGESKRGIINTLLTKPQSIPAGIALSGHPAAELWTDIPTSA